MSEIEYDDDYNQNSDAESGPKRKAMQGTSGKRSPGFTSDSEAPKAPPVEVPIEALSADAVHGIIESFILREGTDYGASEVSLEAKIKQVREQLTHGSIKIVFDPNLESVTILTEREFRKTLVTSTNSLPEVSEEG